MTADWFAERVLTWAEQHGRTNLPWQLNRTPYRVWVSEVMLQQTQVQTVIPYFERFMSSFPSVQALASASRDDVLAHWTGLGYYRRARLLHDGAIQVVQDHDACVPDELEQLMNLPGVGRSTAGAILAAGFNRRGVILDGNVKRVIARFHALDGDVGRATTLKQLWQFADEHTPTARCAEYAQAIMDLGATCCTKADPRCLECPVHERCCAFATDRVAELPRKAKMKRVRHTDLPLCLVFDKKRRLLLQKQPPDGLWGGLWLPPRFNVDIENPIDLLAKVTTTHPSIDHVESLASFTHTLSHIRFKVKPSVIYLSQEMSDEPISEEFAWFERANLSTVGMSRLTLKLLREVSVA